jgi:anaerobic ribonucleoside-triphosphate reductase activating protein
VDGPGIRYVVFGQGCPLKCPNCHNPDTHDFFGGELAEIDDIVNQIKADPLLDGVTFSGGEPFAQVAAFAELARQLAGEHIICYSGYTFEELYNNNETYPLLRRISVLVDGRFENSLKQFAPESGESGKSGRFKGSSNQRAIDVKESFKHGKAIEITL